MAAYNNGSRRAPNASQYLANLNTVPTAHDIPAANANDINLADADLDFLTHAEFFDFDSFDPNNIDQYHGSPTHGGRNQGQHVAVNAPGFQYGEFQSYPPVVGSSPDASTGLQTPQYPHQGSFPQPGDKRKASTSNIPSPADLEEQSRFAAEEDKRRRNTAASARFRVKKKQREQALEKAAKEMTDKVSQLEGKVQQLEMENKWLKGLITDKNDGKTLETLQKEKESEDRKPGDNTDGVGTDVKDEM